MNNKTGLKNKGGRPLTFKTVEELQVKIEEYFKHCWRQKIDMWGGLVFEKDAKGKKTDIPVLVQWKPYTVAGLAVYLECSEDTLLNYAKDKRHQKGFFGAIKRAKDIIYGYKQEFLYSGKNPTGAIFDLKNNYGWKDKTEVDNKHSGNLTVIEKLYPPNE